jgi:hypothetical protein
VVQQQNTDSTAVSVREVEKIIHIPGDTVFVSMPTIIVPSTGSVSGAPKYVPNVQTVETKRSKVRLEITTLGEIKATAICKELEEKVTVLEWTISNYKSEIKEYQVKESFMKRTIDSAKRTIRIILITLALLIVVYTAYQSRNIIVSIIKKLLNFK